MAEFAVGLTKTVVEGAVSKVKSAIEEEKKLKEKVENDLVFITGEFEMMQSVLNVANKERTKNKVLGTWVRQLRDLAFDVEDCVEFVVHLDKDKLTWWWSLLPSCVAPSRPIDDAATQIRQLKARVEDLSQRNTRYNLISDSGSDSKAITVVEQPTPATTNKSAFDVLCEVWEATGKWRGMGDLEKLINSEGDDLQVISVWGNAGAHAELGTTPIFNKVYIDSEICQEFKTRAWVKLMTPINPDEFRKSLLTQFCATSDKANDFCATMKASVDMEDDLMMQQLMGGHRYLVILEGLTTKAEWDVIKKYLPDSKNGSRIIMSTKQLRTALFCAGKPYQLSDFTEFTNHQSLLALSNKALRRRSGKGELIWQIRCRGVVSVWGTDTDDDVKSAVMYKVYASIMYKSKQFEGVEFERHSWVNVPYQIDSEEFDMEVLARRLFVHFLSEDLQVEAIAEVGKMRDPDLTRECCRFLREEDCLVVINGLRSTHDWDRIKDAFLSEPIRGCMVVISNEEGVATHCVGEEHAVLSMKKDLEADPVLRPLIKCCRQLYGNGTAGGNKNCRRGHVLSTRREEARNWDNIYCGVRRDEVFHGLHRGHPGVISLWGTAGAGKSTAVRNEYYQSMGFYEMGWELDYEEESQTNKSKYSMFSWVDVPHPFNLTVFFQLLLLDFHSFDLRAKESAAISMMEGQDPIQWCRVILREEKCLVVIDDLRSTHDWDLIKKALLSKLPNINNGRAIVITNEEAVAKYCVHQDQNQVIHIEDFEPNPTLPPLIKGCRYGRKEACSLFSNRMEEARGWTVPTFKLLGRQSIAANALSNCIVFDHLDHDGSCVFSVWGISGVGKSAVVRNVYSHIMLGLSHQLKAENGERKWGNYEKRYTMSSWVEVPHPLNLAELSSRMLLDFQSDNPQFKENTAVGIMEGQDPIQVCRRIMCEEKCLVVIDGLQSKADWDCIKAAFLPETTKSCIIVITNEASVARHCVNNMEDRVVNVKCLEADAALSLFKKVIAKESMDSEVKELSTPIMAKCGGIPRVITILGEYVVGCGSDDWSLLECLKYINYDFMVKLETQPEFYKLSGLLFWMGRYFEACPDLLKPCIFYLQVFPMDTQKIIRRRRLVRRWIAEGYSRDTSGSTMEENGERLFSELVDLSIIQHEESKGLWQVNGFFHEYIISRPMEDNHVTALEGHCSLNTQRAGQHLTIRECWDRDETVFGGIDFSRLRSLTVFGEWKPFMVTDKMSLVRVLDLENTSKKGECVTNDGLKHIVEVVPRLKFLSLRGCKAISRLPDSLGSLRQLQTLDVRETSIVTLPQPIVKLQKMQYIRAGTSDGKAGDFQGTSTPLEGSDSTILAARDQVQTSRPRSMVSWLSKLHGHCCLDNVGVAIPAGIVNTVALHTLGVVNVSAAGGKAFLKELNKLSQLRKLGVCGINGENWKDFCSAISGHAHLESLSVQLEKDNQGFGANLDDICQPPKTKTLKSLKVYGNVRILPACILQFENLKKGNLELTLLTQEDNDKLEYLPHRSIVRRLCVKPVVEEDCILRVGKRPGEAILCSALNESFRFRVLEIDCTSTLHVQFGIYFVESIEVLMVRCSSGSSLQISGLWRLQKLKEVCLEGSYSDQLKQDLQRQISEHPNEPVLKEL